MSHTVSHFFGRLLTGLTFGKRGSAVYARLYDKTREADPEAVIRDRWSASLGRPLPSDATVWRVEFEVRGEYLRTLSDGDEHIPTDPRELLECHLDHVWEHLTSSWLVLRNRRTASRLARCKPQSWWAAMSQLRGLSNATSAEVRLRRRERTDSDADRLLRQAAGVLAAFAARREDKSLDAAIRALRVHLEADEGEATFSAAVERARLRLPLAAKTRAQAERTPLSSPPPGWVLDELPGWS